MHFLFFVLLLLQPKRIFSYDQNAFGLAIVAVQTDSG